jgi:DNA-binding PadR family transcriptional regulator
MDNPSPLPSLSDREAMILWVVGENLRHGLYGADIRRRIKEEHEKSIALGSLYVTLGRLVDKGFIERVEGARVSGTENMRRQYYRITKSGADALQAKAAALRGVQRLAWGGVS